MNTYQRLFILTAIILATVVFSQVVFADPKHNGHAFFPADDARDLKQRQRCYIPCPDRFHSFVYRER
ncbi:MAG: hypothetical protein KZQ99_04550 [Candidatus Thiodiazotropha sp. (ex Dulcina madagascariensis)]|nr:hypothetical protein [Candidatus Thiodiazotropha sp. (ex Dulcina madagascariensis)]